MELLEGLLDRMEAVMLLHNQGCTNYDKRFTISYKEITPNDLSDIVVDVATDISTYNLSYRVHPLNQDLTKIVTFSASALYKRDPKFQSQPLFYSYIGFLDDIYDGHGMTLRNFGESAFYAENLDTMLRKGQWLAPFCFFRGIDLSFDKCAIPRVKGLMKELSGNRD